jgi:hypothetical protein
MKKIIFSLSVLLGISYASAASCVDLTSVLSKGAENSRVLALQNFLFEKGYLKAKPNGYFGVGTMAAVKAYQKSIGLEQAGSVGPGTRAAIRKETCGVTTASTNQTTQTSNTPTTGITVPIIKEAVYKPTVPVVNTPSGLRNAKRREDLEKLLKSLYSRYVDSRGVHPVIVTDTPIELCVKPVYVPPTATATEVAVLATPESPCKDFVDIAYLMPSYMTRIPRDPSVATTSALTGYMIARSENNQITLSAKSPEDKAIVKVTCNFNGYCQDLKHISTISYEAPIFASSSKPIILRDTVPKIPLTFYGKNFTATNTVALVSKYTGKRYILGSFASVDGVTLPLTATSTNQLFPCGVDCNDKIPFGDYSFTITNVGGTSNLGYLTLKGVTTSSYMARSDASVTPNTKKVKLGSVAISADVSIKLKSLTLVSTSSSSVLPSKISNFVLKDPADGTTYGGPSFSFNNLGMYENQSKLFDLYADFADVQPQEAGFMTYGGKFLISDVLTGGEMELPIKEISFTVSY